MARVVDVGATGQLDELENGKFAFDQYSTSNRVPAASPPDTPGTPRAGWVRAAKLPEIPPSASTMMNLEATAGM